MIRPYWYWPYSREEYLPLARRVSEGADVKQLTVSTISRPGAWPAMDGDRLHVQHDLRPVGRVRGARRVLDRPHVHVQRAVARRRAVAADGPDLVHVWFVSPWLDPIDLRVRRRQPTLLHVHDVWPHERALPEQLMRPLLRSLYSAPGGLVVYHESLRELLVQDFGIGRDSIHLVPHVVPPPAVPAPPEERVTDEVVVLFFGTLRRNKGLELLLATIDRLGPDRGIRWVIAGGGDAELEARVADAATTRSHVDARIGWHTFAAKSALYHQADLVVLPYTSFASQSGVLHDAYGHGKPVVVTDVGALGPSVEKDASGWVVPSGDVAALAEVIAAAAADAPGRASRAAAAASEAARRSPDVVADAILDVYGDVLGTR